jgi:hypothetical protein
VYEDCLCQEIDQSLDIGRSLLVLLTLSGFVYEDCLCQEIDCLCLEYVDRLIPMSRV